MSKGKLICLESPDGGGKGTQCDLIMKYFDKNNISYKFLHFPMYGDNEFSSVISSFLRGEFGDSNKVNPYFPANIYAMDQFLFLPKLLQYLEEYDVVLLDRYVFSNIAYQGSKFPNNSKESKDIKRWISNFQWDFLNMPYPDLNIFLYVPIEITKNRLSERKQNETREYLEGKEDIHEKDLDLQERVNYNYLKEFNDSYNCKIIECSYKDSDGKVLSLTPDEIFNKYISYITEIIWD